MHMRISKMRERSQVPLGGHVYNPRKEKERPGLCFRVLQGIRFETHSQKQRLDSILNWSHMEWDGGITNRRRPCHHPRMSPSSLGRSPPVLHTHFYHIPDGLVYVYTSMPLSVSASQSCTCFSEPGAPFIEHTTTTSAPQTDNQASRMLGSNRLWAPWREKWSHGIVNHLGSGWCPPRTWQFSISINNALGSSHPVLASYHNIYCQ